MKTSITLAVALLLTTFGPLAQAEASEIYVGNVTGLLNGTVPVGSQVSIRLNLYNSESFKARAISNGFRVYGSDTAISWGLIHYWASEVFTGAYWPGVYFYTNPISGDVPDTIDVKTNEYLNYGIPPYYNWEFIYIELALSGAPPGGGSLCLDSCWFPPEGEWMWNFGSAYGSWPPDWNGPYCWPIAACEGMRGNVDYDPADAVDISDLVYLADYMFTEGTAPPCFYEADINGSGGDVVDITDMVHLVDYMFNDGPPPAACP